VNLLHLVKIRKHQHGQIFVVLAILIPILIIFIGLSIDFGMAYMTKTTLSKALDAAALAAMKNLNQGQTKAAALAGNVFLVNYQSIPGLGTAPTPTIANNGINWSIDSNNNTLVTISATATLNTYFLSVMDLIVGGSTYKTLNITESAQAIRNPLVMSLINDRSGSMNKNGGSGALPGDVTDFLSYFDQGVDNIAEVSFSSTSTVDVAMTTEFVTPITNAVNGMSFVGGTFAQAGLQDGFNQILSIPPSPNIIRVAVFFTDGWANMDGLAAGSTGTSASTTHDQLNCTGTTKKPVLINVDYGGCSPAESAVGWCSGVSFMNPADPNPADTISCPNAADNATSTRPGLTSPITFPVQEPGMSGSLNPNNGNARGDGQYDIANDATYRTEQLANLMRNSTNNITIYSIGLGNKINEQYLQEIANDPNSPTYDSSQPQGEAVFAPTATDLQAAYETIASKILLRLAK
jgi:Flp pilus assembly protein TadG